VLHIPKDVQALVREYNLFLAGGFLRSTIHNERPSDIDLFGSDKAQLHEVAMKLAISRKGRLHETENAYTVLTQGRTPVQFIHRWVYTEPLELLNEFDFTIARAVLWWKKDIERWASLCDADYYADVATKRLIYCKPERDEAAGGSLLRARKLLTKGYFISARDLGLVIARLMGSVRLEECDTTEKMEDVIIGLLHEVDPLMVVDGVDLVDEHASVSTEGDGQPTITQPSTGMTWLDNAAIEIMANNYHAWHEGCGMACDECAEAERQGFDLDQKINDIWRSQSNRIANFLACNHIKTYRGLITLNTSAILKSKNIGRVSLREIRDHLDSLGLSLKGDEKRRREK
jgi:hypothetical protein